VACRLGVFLIETDRTLVDSHSALLSLWLCPLFLASHFCPDCYFMSVRPEGAPEIWSGLPCYQESQFRTREKVLRFWLCRRQALSRNDVTPV